MPGVFEKEHYVRECSQLDTIFLSLHLAMSLVQRRTIIAKQQVSLQTRHSYPSIDTVRPCASETATCVTATSLPASHKQRSSHAALPHQPGLQQISYYNQQHRPQPSHLMHNSTQLAFALAALTCLPSLLPLLLLSCKVYVFNIACVIFTATLLLKHFAKHWYHRWRTQIVFVLHIILTTLRALAVLPMASKQVVHWRVSLSGGQDSVAVLVATILSVLGGPFR